MVVAFAGEATPVQSPLNTAAPSLGSFAGDGEIAVNARSGKILVFESLFYAAYALRLVLLPFHARIYNMPLDLQVFLNALWLVVLLCYMVWLVARRDWKWPICVFGLFFLLGLPSNLQEIAEFGRTASVLTLSTAALTLLQVVMQLGGLLFLFWDMATRQWRALPFP